MNREIDATETFDVTLRITVPVEQSKGGWEPLPILIAARKALQMGADHDGDACESLTIARVRPPLPTIERVESPTEGPE